MLRLEGPESIQAWQILLRTLPLKFYTNSMAKHTILLVDDEVDNVDALERIFRSQYNVLKATSARLALETLDQHPGPVSVIITDQRMPEMTGVEFLSESMKTHPEAVRLLLTGYTDIESIIEAVNSGQIFRYLTKPWDPVDLLNTVRMAAEKFRLTQELKEKNISLSKALAELETLDQAKNQFMVLINHELKTPLTSILSFLELLKETHLTDEQDLCVQRIDKASERLRQLIQDVLIVVAGETKTLKLRTQPFDAKNLEDVMSRDLSLAVQKKNQNLKFDLEDKKLIGDQEFILQIIHRLIHNAAKFGDSNSTIYVKSELTSPHKIKISVANRGQRISQTVIDKILKPFFIDEDVMNHSTGLGLGLTICQSILKAHQSQLVITNDDHGVTVSFELACL